MAQVWRSTVLLRDPPPHAGFSPFLLQLPNNNQKWGSPPFLKPCSPWPLRAFFHKQPRPSISVLRVSGPWRGHADFEEVKGAGVRPSSNKWVAVRRDRCCSFPASEEEPVRKMERPAGPRPRPLRGGWTDAGSCAAPGCQGPASQRRGPLVPLPGAPPDLSAPSTTQDPAFQGAKGQALGLPGMGSLARWRGQSRTSYSLQARPWEGSSPCQPPVDSFQSSTACSPSREPPQAVLCGIPSVPIPQSHLESSLVKENEMD